MPAKRPASWILLHLLAIALVLLNLATGLRIAILDTPWLLWLSPLLPQGALHWLHIVGGCGMTALAGIYLLRQPIASDKPHPQTKTVSQRFHHIVTWFGYLLVLLAILTGWLFVFDQQSVIPLVDLHLYTALGFILYFLLHSGGYFIEFGWPAIKRILLPARHGLTQGIITLAAIAITSLWLWWQFGKQPTDALTVKQIPISTFISIDGQANEPIWQQADPITILTHGGANFVNGETPITVKALENGKEAFFHISWQDPTKSLKHLPLIKTAAGWKVQQQGFHNFNETRFYEDKLAVMLSNRCEVGGAGSAHLGPKPLADKPANWHGKGYHYTDDGSVRDIWHWKAVRTNDMQLADDNFFAAPIEPQPGFRRYKAGYVADGKESGAYVMNWQWYQPEAIVPKRLPKYPELLAPYQPAAGHASLLNNQHLSWVISWFDYEPYRQANDHFPPGTVMPSVMYRSNQFEGDRAHVRAHGIWKNGGWSLELSRPLDTGSDYDIAINTGTCLWVSAFDHSQVAHTRHQRGIRLILERQYD